jgi:hypothetical protein
MAATKKASATKKKRAPTATKKASGRKMSGAANKGQV